jgi:hypothetical protein
MEIRCGRRYNTYKRRTLVGDDSSGGLRESLTDTSTDSEHDAPRLDLVVSPAEEAGAVDDEVEEEAFDSKKR